LHIQHSRTLRTTQLFSNTSPAGNIGGRHLCLPCNQRDRGEVQTSHPKSADSRAGRRADGQTGRRAGRQDFYVMPIRNTTYLPRHSCCHFASATQGYEVKEVLWSTHFGRAIWGVGVNTCEHSYENARKSCGIDDAKVPSPPGGGRGKLYRGWSSGAEGIAGLSTGCGPEIERSVCMYICRTTSSQSPHW